MAWHLVERAAPATPARFLPPGIATPILVAARSAGHRAPAGDRMSTAPHDAASTSSAQAESAGLRYVQDDMPGIRRLRAGRGFRYLDPAGQPVSANTKARITALAIPPAWTDVWIAPIANAHLQATGRDQKGRKQYRYHPGWTAAQAESKFERLPAFGKLLPRIRRQVDIDLRRHGLPREKVVALAVHLLDTTHIRIGNDAYARENGSFGLTTLRRTHAEIIGADIRLSFDGKSGKAWSVDYRDNRAARIIRRCQELPGQRLFQYRDEAGALQPIRSDDVNAWLAEVTGGNYTAKDFRTWSGSVLVAAHLRDTEPPESDAAAKREIVAAVDAVAAALGNTRAVCRASYIHPDVLDAFASGRLKEVDLRRVGVSSHDAKLLEADERFLLALLAHRCTREASA